MKEAIRKQILKVFSFRRIKVQDIDTRQWEMATYYQVLGITMRIKYKPIK